MAIYSYPQRSVKGEKRTVLYGKNSIIVFRKKLGGGGGVCFKTRLQWRKKKWKEENGKRLFFYFDFLGQQRDRKELKLFVGID